MIRKIFITLLVIIVIAIAYVLYGINKNVQEMIASYATAFYFPEYPVLNLKDKTPDEVASIQRGEYLVKAGDCIACHTDTNTKGPDFAGGLAMYTPFGIIYTPNITPDVETGIGSWDDEQFIKAMHEGISPSGSPYFPAFPYIYFNMVSREDLIDIKNYLDNIPAVHKQNHPNEMVLPFNWRYLQYGWRKLFFDPKRGPFKPDPNKTAAWNRGAYLVEGLGHCAMCHTPSYNLLNQNLSLGAPIRKYDLTGNVVQGYLAPNITQTNLGAITDDQMIEIFTKGVLLGGANIQGPMLEAVHDSLSHLTRDDLIAISTYLREKKSTLPNEVVPGANAQGAIIYNNYCSGCHASGVGGAPRFGDAASWVPLVKSGMKRLYVVAIDGVGDMPPKGTCYNCMNSDIKAAVNYMAAAALSGTDHPVVVGTTQAPLTMMDGKRIYEANCSSCHATGTNGAPQIGDKEAWKPIVDTGFLTAYHNVAGGFAGHPARGGCPQCTDAELLVAVKYIMQQSATDKNYILW